MGFIGELKRRNVIRVAIAYLVFAWLVMQVLDVVGPVLELPKGGVRMVLVLLALGFVGVVVFSWAYELTPEGLKRESEVDRTQSVTQVTAKKLDIAVIVLLVLAFGVFVFDRLSPEVATQRPSVADQPVAPGAVPVATPAATAAQKSIAVLPFVNMSSDAEQVYFSDGLSEELLNGLAKVPGLKVSGRTSSFAFRDKQDDLRAIGKALGVGHILEGSVRKQGMRVRITAQLIKADDGFHLWSETYDRDAGDIFALQDEITTAIIDVLKVKLGTAETPSTPVADLDAYNLYLQARQKLALRGVDNIRAARALFEQAIARDSNYAPAHAGLARAVTLLWQYGYDLGASIPITREQAAAAGQAAARAALALDPDSAEAWSVLGFIGLLLDPDIIAAEEAIGRSVALRPNDSEILNFAGDFYYWTMDPRVEDTERRAAELDPLRSFNHHDLAQALVAKGKFEAALKSAEAADALGFYAVSPSAVMNTTLPALLALRRFDEARRLADRLERSTEMPRAIMVSIRHTIALAAGEDAGADKLLQELLGRAGAGDLPSLAAWQLLSAGRNDEAVSWLRRCFDEGDLWILDPQWFPLPERLPDHAAVRATYDRPELKPLFEMRRRNLARQTGVQP